MYKFRYISVCVLFFVVSTNVYTQKKSDDLRDSVNHYIFLRDSLKTETEDYAIVINSIASFCSDINALDGYFVLFLDGKYINQGILKGNDGDLYTKYNPNRKDDNEMMCAIMETKNRKKMYYWVAEELKKGSIVSINNANKKKTFVCKSFNSI